MSGRAGTATSADILVMRAFVKMVANSPRRVSIAAARWMWEIANDPKTVTQEDAGIDPPDTAMAKECKA